MLVTCLFQISVYRLTCLLSLNHAIDRGLKEQVESVHFANCDMSNDRFSLILYEEDQD